MLTRHMEVRKKDWRIAREGNVGAAANELTNYSVESPRRHVVGRGGRDIRKEEGGNGWEGGGRRRNWGVKGGRGEGLASWYFSFESSAVSPPHLPSCVLPPMRSKSQNPFPF